MTGLILPTVHNSELSLEAEGAFRGIHSAVTLLVYCTAPPTLRLPIGGLTRYRRLSHLFLRRTCGSLLVTLSHALMSHTARRSTVAHRTTTTPPLHSSSLVQAERPLIVDDGPN